MKNLIYQYWDGVFTRGNQAGSDAMRQYADRIGAEYLFELNPRFVTNLGSYSPHYGAFKPIYDKKFDKYDNILFADTDIFPVDGLSVSIFDGFIEDVGICTEPFQPEFRSKSSGHISGVNDEKWAKMVKSTWGMIMPRTLSGLLKVYNSGVVLYSRSGLEKAKSGFVPFKKYVDLVRSYKLGSFYTCDQPYLHAMLFVAKMRFVELDNGWNSYVHYLGSPKMANRPINDTRTNNTKFVHVQLRGADLFEADKLWRITNLPVSEWGL